MFCNNNFIGSLNGWKWKSKWVENGSLNGWKINGSLNGWKIKKFIIKKG